MKLFPSSQRLAAAGPRNGLNFTITVSAVFLLAASLPDSAQENALSKTQGISSADSGAAAGAQAASGSPGKSDSAVESASQVNTTGFGKINLANIVLTDKKIRTYGWGEYRVGGHCLCCDNMRSTDCIAVQTINRTDKVRVKQIVDGKTDADTSDNTAYFGEIYERDEPTKPVALLMAEISWSKLQEIYRVIVYTMVDKGRKKSFLSDCELGYTDQFDRLQWAGKAENKEHGDRITFDLEKPILTKSILLKAKGGRSRITEVAIFAKD